MAREAAEKMLAELDSLVSENSDLHSAVKVRIHHADTDVSGMYPHASTLRSSAMAHAELIRLCSALLRKCQSELRSAGEQAAD